MTEETFAVLVAEVIKEHPGAKSHEVLGRALDAKISAKGDDAAKGRRRLMELNALGRSVAATKAATARSEAPKVTHDGRAMDMTPTITVKNQLRLWTEVSPKEWVDAVLREDRVSRGRARMNAVRMEIAKLVDGDERLLALDTMGDVCEALGLDPTNVNLDDLAS
jgi:hypothetical protein